LSRLSEAQVDRIAARLAQRLGNPVGAGMVGPARPRTGSSTAEPLPAAPLEPLGDGIHADVEGAVAAAGRAFRRLQEASLSLRRDLLAALRRELLGEAESLARLAHEETGYGRVADKIVKNRLVTLNTPGTEDLAPEAVSGDRGLMLGEPAPFGVIGAITPVTNPTSTVICNAIGMLAAGNSVVFNPHPSARRASNRTVQLINHAIVAAGGPPDLVNSVARPTIESAQGLMRHPGVRLLVVTGGPAVVRAAMNSGKRAICAGPGNPPVVVDETADLAQAGRDIVRGASFDNNIICTDEKETFVVAEVAGRLLEAMAGSGARVLTAGELRRLEDHIFAEPPPRGQAGKINRDLIGQDAGRILSRIGASADPETRLLVAEVDRDHPLVWTEQMMPVMPVVRCADADEAIDLALRAEGGNRHTAAMHSKHLDRLSRMAREINCSIFVKNGPCFSGLGEGGEGYSSFTIASPTGEGMTGPRSFSRRRRCVLVDQFRIV
jgi:aldehyde dehydrogenase